MDIKLPIVDFHPTNPDGRRLSLDDPREEFPKPPDECFCSPRSGSAFVWWKAQNDCSTVTEWEIHRHRRDPGKSGEWRTKGFTVHNHHSKIYRVLVEDLPNGFEYRFSVRARKNDDASNDSPFSNIIFVDAPLPTWWFRLYDNDEYAFYYLNIKTQETSWTRPEADKYFLEDCFESNFNNAELRHLRSIFDDELFHHNHIDPVRMQAILFVLGDNLKKYSIIHLFQAYARCRDEVRTWQQFIAIIDHVKRLHQKSVTLSIVGNSRVFACCFCCQHIRLNKRANNTYGNWNREWDIISRRYYYSNKKTGELFWGVPEDVRTYLPPPVEEKLLLKLEHDHIDLFKSHFTWADTKMNGSLEDLNFTILLNKLNIHVSDPGQMKWLKYTIDKNRNGTIEFSEFCLFLLKLVTPPPDRSGFWRKLPAYEDIFFDQNIQLPLYYYLKHDKNFDVNVYLEDNNIGNSTSTSNSTVAKAAISMLRQPSLHPFDEDNNNNNNPNANTPSRSPTGSPFKWTPKITDMSTTPTATTTRNKNIKETLLLDVSSEVLHIKTFQFTSHPGGCMCGCRGRRPSANLGR
eukprot:gene4539-9006_t